MFGGCLWLKLLILLLLGMCWECWFWFCFGCCWILLCELWCIFCGGFSLVCCFVLSVVVFVLGWLVFVIFFDEFWFNLFGWVGCIRCWDVFWLWCDCCVLMLKFDDVCFEIVKLDFIIGFWFIGLYFGFVLFEVNKFEGVYCIGLLDVFIVFRVLCVLFDLERLVIGFILFDDGCVICCFWCLKFDRFGL